MTATRETLREATPTPETADIAGLVEPVAWMSVLTRGVTTRKPPREWAAIYAPLYPATALQSLSAELAEAKRDNEALTNRAEVAEYKQQQAINEILPMALARATNAEAEAEARAMREALTPSGDTKAAYVGEFSMPVTLRLRHEEEVRRVEVPWTTIKEIMAAIKARALGGTNAE